MTLQDDFLAELQYAADRVGPVAGLDGVAIARRAVRRERVRRGALTGVGGLTAVGVIAGAWLVADPTTTNDPATTGVPAGWTPVSVGGLGLAVPPGLESGVDGVWEDGDNFVQIQPADDLPLVPEGSGLTPTDVVVPGAASAQYVSRADSDPTMVQDFEGDLHVHLESGDVVQVTLIWVEADEGEEVFADLVRSVFVDDSTPALPSPEATPGLLQLEGFAPGVPDGWQEAEFAGLDYAVPPGWVEDENTADAYPVGSSFRAASADGTSSLTILQAVDAGGWPDSIAPSALYPAHTFPLDGADVVQVELRSSDGRDRTTARVRREDGRAYIVTVENTADGHALALEFLGALGFAAGSQALPGPDDLPQLPTSEPSEGWTDARWDDVRLAVPPEWTEVPTHDGGGTSWVSDVDAAQPEEKISVSAGTSENGIDALLPYGYRYDVPGAERTVIQVGEQSGTDGGSGFVGTVELYRGDERVTLEYSGPPNGDSQERFGMIVQSLELAGR